MLCSLRPLSDLIHHDLERKLGHMLEKGTFFVRSSGIKLSIISEQVDRVGVGLECTFRHNHTRRKHLTFVLFVVPVDIIIAKV
jgi:hypothetical protein